MKNDEIVFYDSTNDYSKYNKAKQAVYESYSESQDWTDIDDVPDDMVWEEIAAQNEADWEYFATALKHRLETDDYIIMGTCGRWNGPCGAGNFISSFEDFCAFLQHLDCLKIYEQNGHLYIEGFHHDGQDRYELKRLTNNGTKYARRNDFAHDKALHLRIISSNFYSALPKLSDTLYRKKENKLCQN